MHDQDPGLDIANATSAVVVSLLKALVNKAILSGPEARAILTRAASDLGPHEYTVPVKGAIGIILNDLLPKFPEDGGD